MSHMSPWNSIVTSLLTSRSRLRLKRDGTRAETRFRLSAKRTSPFKSAGTSVQSTTGSRSVRISGSNAGYTKFRGSVKSTGYPFHSPFSPSLPLPCVTVCHHISTGLYLFVEAYCCLVLYFDGACWEMPFPEQWRVQLRSNACGWIPKSGITHTIQTVKT
jgi:hypothetical protein